MLHRNGINNFNGTQELVYSNSPTGKSEDFLVERVSSLQQGFDSDSKACLPVGIDNLTASAFEQGVVGTMPISQSTAVATPFGSVPTIYDVQSNVIVKASLLKNLSEFIKRNSHNSPVEYSSFGIESFKLLDRNISVKSISNFNNFSDNLSEIGLDKISFITFNPFELFDSVQGLKLRSPLHNLLSFSPDVFSEIGLIENSAFWRDDADSKMFGIDINSKNILSLLDFFFLRQIGNNLQISSQTKSLTSPAIFNQTLKSLVVPVLFDWNGNSVSWICSKFNKEIGFCAESLAVSRNVEFDKKPVDFIGFLSPYLPFDVADDLGIEGGAFFAS